MSSARLNFTLLSLTLHCGWNNSVVWRQKQIVCCILWSVVPHAYEPCCVGRWVGSWTGLIWCLRAPDRGSTVGGLLSVSPPEEHYERHTFFRRGGNPRTCDSGSVINSWRGLCWQFPKALWTSPRVCCEGWRLFWRPIKLICLYLLFCLFYGTNHRTF
jgi:hypothetical protein